MFLSGRVYLNRNNTTLKRTCCLQLLFCRNIQKALRHFLTGQENNNLRMIVVPKTCLPVCLKKKLNIKKEKRKSIKGHRFMRKKTSIQSIVFGCRGKKSLIDVELSTLNIFDVLSFKGNGCFWSWRRSTFHELQNLLNPRLHRVTLRELQPAAIYYLRNC